jgi:hypothetical protein
MREADVVVNQTRIAVRQESTACAFGVSITAATVPATGATLNVAVTAIDGCAWNATSGATWITVPPGSSSGSGNGTANVQIASNAGAARAGSLTVAGHTIAVSQSASGTSGCTYAIQPPTQAAPASGGPATASVTSGAGCAWTATADVPWLTITAGVAGNGNGTVAYTVGTNTTPAARTGRISVEGQALTVNQSAGSQSCNYTINPDSRQIGSSGGAVAVSVNVATGCVWTAVSNASWLTIVSGTTGDGNGSVNVDVAATNGPTRTGTLTIAGRTFSVIQSNGCTYVLNPLELEIDAAGGTSSTAVTAGAGCTWNASVSAQSPWITITSGGSGSGNGTVAFTVAANGGPPRNGSLTIAGQPFPVRQITGCAYSIAPVSASVGSSGGQASATVTAGPGCSWNASSDDAWITITAGSSGSGSGTVNFTVASHTGPERKGTLTIAGDTFTVTQASGCSYTIVPDSALVGSEGGQRSTNIVTGDQCPWTATVSPQAPWISLASSGNGSGDGTVSFNIASNAGPQRIGTLSIEGHTFTVTQENGCSYSVSTPSPLNFAAGGGSGSASVNVGAGCPWSASSDQPFLTITAPAGGDGSGSGQVTYSVSGNSGVARAATLTIAGQTFTVNQASGCTVTVSQQPSPLSFGAGGGTGSATVTASGSGCTWSAASSNPAILTITLPSGGNGIGTGQVNYSVSANTGPARSATLTIAGQNFTVSQATGCTVTISTSPSPIAFASAGGNGSAAVTAPAGCTWSASSNQPFLTISQPSGGNGTGSGPVSYSVAANSGPARSATLTIAGQQFTVTQATGCTTTVSQAPSPLSFASGGGTGSAMVTASAPGCTWSASSNQSFLTITQPAGGNGSGTSAVTYSVAQSNNEPARTATLTIAGQAFTVSQASGCTYMATVSPTAFSIGGGPGNISMKTGANCAWSVAVTGGTAAMIQFPAGTSGNGPGSIGFVILPSISGRSVTITVTSSPAGLYSQPFTITQN